MKKKMLSLALALVMCLSLMPGAFAAERASKFTDVPENAWYLDELDYAVYNGYINGTGETTFSPDLDVTRGQFVTILGRMLDAPTDSGKTSFGDVREDIFYAPYVAWASSKGYVNGYSATEFGPENSITVEQMGTILSNYIENSSVTIKESPVTYTDVDRISAWAQSAMAQMAKFNLLPTDAYGNVNPQKSVTRAEAAVALVRLAKALDLGVVPPVQQTTTSTEQTTTEGEINYTEALYAKVAEIHDGLWASGQLTNSMTEKEKAIVYFHWMCENCEYRFVSSDSYTDLGHTPYGALVLGSGVCDGLSYAYRMLLETEGIECLCAESNKNFVGHMWNEASLDDEWYKIDLTGAYMLSSNADGSFNELLWKTHACRKYFESTIDGPSETAERRTSYMEK